MSYLDQKVEAILKFYKELTASVHELYPYLKNIEVSLDDRWNLFQKISHLIERKSVV